MFKFFIKIIFLSQLISCNQNSNSLNKDSFEDEIGNGNKTPIGNQNNNKNIDLKNFINNNNEKKPPEIDIQKLEKAYSNLTNIQKERFLVSYYLAQQSFKISLDVLSKIFLNNKKSDKEEYLLYMMLEDMRVRGMEENLSKENIPLELSDLISKQEIYILDQLYKDFSKYSIEENKDIETVMNLLLFYKHILLRIDTAKDIEFKPAIFSEEFSRNKSDAIFKATSKIPDIIAKAKQNMIQNEKDLQNLFKKDIKMDNLRPINYNIFLYKMEGDEKPNEIIERVKKNPEYYKREYDKIINKLNTTNYKVDDADIKIIKEYELYKFGYLQEKEWNKKNIEFQEKYVKVNEIIDKIKKGEKITKKTLNQKDLELIKDYIPYIEEETGKIF